MVKLGHYLRLPVSVIVAGILLCACAGTSSRHNIARSFSTLEQQTIYIMMPWNEKVKIGGYLNLSDLEPMDGSVMLYQGGLGLAVVAAQLAGQATFESSVNNKRYAEARENANLVLRPYISDLSSFDHSVLWKNLDKTFFSKNEILRHTENNHNEDSLILELRPVFTLTQDKQALSLENQVLLYKKGFANKPMLKNTIIVISDSVGNNLDEIENFWGDTESKAFQSVGSILFNRSVSLLVQDIENQLPANSSQKTYHYRFGGLKQFERGAMIHDECDRITIKNLYGYIMNLPKVDEDCK